MARPNGLIHSPVKSPQHTNFYTVPILQETHHKQGNGRLRYPIKSLRSLGAKRSTTSTGSRGSSVVCQSTETRDTETQDQVTHYGDCSNMSRAGKSNFSSQGLAQACKYVRNDAKFVNERAKNDLILLSRGIMRLDARVRQDVAFLGSEFLKLDARAREDTEKIDYNVKMRAERIQYIATILKNEAQSKLKMAADKHWSDGALEADLKRADFVAKRRAMEDSLMALEFVKNIHDMMVSKMYELKSDTKNTSDIIRHITLEKNGQTMDFIPGEVSVDRVDAMQEAYRSIVSALSEADGIDYTDPEELELLVATLIDLDAMDGKSTVSLLAECSNSPDVRTRKALANALSAAPSMWTLGNAGMGALQRLANDSNPAIAAAASKTIKELKKQWEIQEGDTWRFMMNQNSMRDSEDEDGIE